MPLIRLNALRHHALPALLLVLLGSGTALAGTPQDLRQAREIFKSVYPEAERGNWDAVDALAPADRQALADYVLWPDLRAAWLRASLARADRADIEDYLDTYGVLKPARQLRYRYALWLAQRGRLADFLVIYQQYYQGLDIARLDCLALQAELAAGRDRRVVNRGIELWLVGKSQVDECDPVFAWLREQQLLDPAAYRQRFALAIEARDFSMARWLAKPIDAEHVTIAANWQRAASRPADFLRQHGKTAAAGLSAQLVYAVERLTYGDPVLALDLWRDAKRVHAFSDEQHHATDRHIALWTARDRLPGAYALLAALPAPDAEVLRWRARLSLREHDWQRLLQDIAAMPAAERATEEWRYWHAVALCETGQPETGELHLAELARERSFYGFLAADALGSDYALTPTVIAADEAVIAALAARPELIRARELYLVGLDSRGRSEWDSALRSLDGAEQSQAAKLAERWGWHSRAISTAARVGHYDDLALRYPLPYQQAFNAHAESASIPPTWAYGVARSESLFMRDVRSSAGAIGLMQLMPQTGRAMARELQLPYAGLNTLTDPQDNILLGTTYLGRMAQRYGGNRVLATAAYNAGPHRVDRWLPQSGSIDARVWIENIPFNETRKYVRRVLAAETIFHWRMTGELQRLSGALPQVVAAPGAEQLASAALPSPPGR